MIWNQNHKSLQKSIWESRSQFAPKIDLGIQITIHLQNDLEIQITNHSTIDLGIQITIHRLCKILQNSFYLARNFREFYDFLLAREWR